MTRARVRAAAALVLVLAPACAYGCDSTYGADSVPEDAQVPDASATDTSIEDAVAPAEDADAGPTCNLTKPFGTPVLVDGLSTPEHEGAARPTPDELTVYFHAVRSVVSSTSDLYIATRASKSEPFSNVTRLEGASTTQYLETHPLGSEDRRRIVFSRLVDGTWGIYGASRNNAVGPFDAIIGVPVSFPGDDSALQPYAVVEALYYTGFSADAGSPSRIRRAPVVGNGLGPSISFPELDSSSAECNPTVTPDERTIYFCSNRPAAGAKGKLDLYVATRATKNNPFSAIQAVEELNTSANEFPDWISPDGCRLYFTSDRVRGDGTGDIYVAERGR